MIVVIGEVSEVEKFFIKKQARPQTQRNTGAQKHRCIKMFCSFVI